MNKRSFLLLALAVLTASLLSFAMLTRGHPWWDDFAAYLMQAQAILSGSSADFIRHNAFTIQNSSVPPGPVAYPWGFPLLLVPVVALVGLNPLALKLVGIGFYALFLVILFLLARTRLETGDSLLLTGFFALAPSLLLANDLILSDIPFLAFSTLGLLLAEKYARTGKASVSWTGFALGAVIFFAAFLRTNGILLLVPAGVALLAAAWPNWKTALRRSLFPLLSFGLLFALASLVFPNGQDSYFSHFSMFTPARLLDNILFYLWLPARTFDYLPARVIFYPLLAVFLLISLFPHWKRDLALYAYSLVTLGLFIVWPERQGLRFIYPLLPLLFILACDGMRLALNRLPAAWKKPARYAFNGFWALLLLMAFVTSAQMAAANLAANRAINGPFDPYSNELYSFIRAQTPAEAVIIFVRPRALRLFTGRDSFTSASCADLPKGDYVVLHEKMGNIGQIDPSQISACSSVKLTQVFNSKRFTVYKISPP